MSDEALDSFVTDPDWLLAAVHGERQQYLFARVGRDTYRHSPFLDRRIRPKPTEFEWVAVDRINRLLAHVSFNPASVGYIFHTAFCCSTLLASCLQHLQHVLVLKEPTSLATAATAKRIMVGRNRAPDAAWRSVIEPILLLMSKRYDDTSHVVIKPTNYCNNLIPEIMELSAGRCLYLHGSLQDFLHSVLKKPADSVGAMLDEMLAGFERDSDYLQRAREAGFEAQGLLEKAVLMWSHQVDWLATVSARFPGRGRFLSAEQFLANPHETLLRVMAHFGVSNDPAVAREIVEQGPLGIDPKIDGAFSAEQRKRENRKVAEQFGAELAGAVAWFDRLQEQVPAAAIPAGPGVQSG